MPPPAPIVFGTPTDLRNPLIQLHPYQPEDLLDNDQVLELELSHDLFAPGAETWGRLRFVENPNLSQEALNLSENFLALAECAMEMSKKHADQLYNVRLMYISVLSPETFDKMIKKKASPTAMIDKNYSSHILRLVASSHSTLAHQGCHSFANLQQAINSQAARIQMKDAPKKKQKKRRKQRRRQQDEQNHDDNASESDDSSEEPPAVQWERIQHLGVWNWSSLPVFQNPNAPFRGAAGGGVPPTYSYVHHASEHTYKRMVNNFLGLDPALDDDGRDITDPESPYNPLVVFSPMSNLLRRQARLLNNELYTKFRERHFDSEDRKRRDLALSSIQDEIRADRWMKRNLGEPLSVPGPNELIREFHPKGLLGWPSPYGGETCWLLDIEDFRASTFRFRLFPWAGRSTEDCGLSHEKRAFVRGIPKIERIPS